MRRAGCRGHRPIRHRHRHSRAVVVDLAPERGRREGRTVILVFAIGQGGFRYLDRSRERGERDRRSPAADRCSRCWDDGAGIGVPRRRERRRLIPYVSRQ
jgi:hypothetical protein